MKKTLLSLVALCLLGVGNAFAQSDIVVGDMNDDGELTVGDVTALTETVIGRTPRRTIMPAIEWESSNASMATVSADGLVSAVKGGRCTITANDGSGVKATCTVTVAEPIVVPHEYVDLGLPSGTLWATTNVGAESPEDYGYYFAWGEVEPKSTYNWSTYFDSLDGCDFNSVDGWGFDSVDVTDSNFKKYYNNGGKTELDLEDDAAYMNWGDGWRMPSLDQLDELHDTNNCTWQWTTQNNKNGYLVTSKKNGSSLFLPAAGGRDEDSLDGAGSWAYYWSRSLYASSSDCAYDLYFDPIDFYWLSNYRFCGFSVRPVRVSASE